LPIRIRRLGASLRADRRGAALTEFALLIPVFAILLMGSFDMGHTLWMNATLQGAVQKAARDSGIESGLDATNQAALDLLVTNQVKRLHKNATVTISRRYYHSFTATSATKEQWTDTNSNNTCDNNEPYDDDNRDGSWNNAGATGSGSAKDSVVYTVTTSYPRMFPLDKLIGTFWPAFRPSSQVTLTASTVMNNQPFGDQAAGIVGNCP
jgi:Flp pilus assembly protein TadG